MKRIIGRKEYDTKKATIVKKYTYGEFGDPEGYEEILYQTPDGFYFVYVNGGSMSKYPAEEIYRLSKAKLDEWEKQHI